MSEKEGHDIYCDGVKLNYSVNIVYDVFMLLLAVMLNIYALTKYKHFIQSNPNDENSSTSNRANIKMVMIVVSIFTIGLFVKLLNHIFCGIDATITIVTGLLFVASYTGSLSCAMCSFAMRLKSAFSGTIHEPSKTLYATVIGSTIMFITIGIMGAILFGLSAWDRIGDNDALGIVLAVLLLFDFVLYIVVIGCTVGVFATTLRKVKCFLLHWCIYVLLNLKL